MTLLFYLIYIFYDENFRLVFKRMFRHCLLREITPPEFAVDRAKLAALPIDDLVGSICVNLIDDVRSSHLEVDLPPILWVVMIGLLSGIS